MANASATVCTTFWSELEQYSFLKDMGDDLIHRRIRAVEDLSRTTTTLLKPACKSLRDSDNPIAITDMSGYKLYVLCLWVCNRLMMTLDKYPGNFHAGKIPSYITAFRDKQENKDWGEDPVVKVVKMPSPYTKSNRWYQFSKSVWNWMSMQFSVDHIALLVYLFR